MAQAEPAPQRARHLTLGARGEQLAVSYLEAHGCTVLSRNWRCREGELDIIVTDGTKVLICEVKTRGGVGFGTPEESISRTKITRIRRAASKWLSEHQVPYHRDVRFDVISIVIPRGGQPQLRHIPGAF